MMHFGHYSISINMKFRLGQTAFSYIVCGVYLHYFTSKSETKTIETRKKSKKPSKHARKSLFFFRQLQHNLKEHRNPSGAYDHQLN